MLSGLGVVLTGGAVVFFVVLTGGTVVCLQVHGLGVVLTGGTVVFLHVQGLGVVLHVQGLGVVLTGGAVGHLQGAGVVHASSSFLHFSSHFSLCFVQTLGGGCELQHEPWLYNKKIKDDVNPPSQANLCFAFI